MSAHRHQRLDRRRLKERVDYFFSSNVRSRTQVAEFATRMSELGEVAVVGGMLRNLFLEGNREFTSDVDFVIDCSSVSEFERTMIVIGAKQNRFGGFGVSLGKWEVDIWPLQRTWAAMKGYVEVKKLADLLKVTFFNWDEIIYELNSHELITAPNYFEWIANRLLEINLEPNPNPLGNAIRSIRYAWRWNAEFGPCLANHVYSQLHEHGWEKFVHNESLSFSHRVLDRLNGSELIERLRNYVQSQSRMPFKLGIRSHQAPLPFG